MSTLGGINAALRASASVQSGAATFAANQPSLQAQVQQQLTTRMQSTFQSSIDTVLTHASQGTFEDPTLAREAEELRTRIQAGTQQTGTVWTPAPTGSAPLTDATAGTTAGGPSAQAPTGAAPAYDAERFAADQQALLQNYQRQASFRRDRVHQTLESQFPAGAALDSLADAHSGDQRLQATTEAEADAIAQRLAIDMTFAAADMEVAAADLELVRHKASTGSAPAAQVAQAQATYDGARERVNRLGNLVSEIGGDAAVDGMEARATGALDGAGQNALRTAARQGATSDELSRMGALLEAVDEQATTGRSETLDQFRSDLTGIISEWSRLQSDASERAAKRRAEYRKQDEAHMQRKQDQIDQQQRADATRLQQQQSVERAVRERARRRAELGL